MTWVAEAVVLVRLKADEAIDETVFELTAAQSSTLSEAAARSEHVEKISRKKTSR